MKKILITGANGFIGSHLVDFCLTKGCEIYAIERPNQNYQNLSQYTKKKQNFSVLEKGEFLGETIRIPTDNTNLTILECNVLNSELLEKIIIKVNPSLIFHFAAQPYVISSIEDPVNTIKTNVIGTLNIFEPIKKHKLKTKVILACTSTEYGTTTELNRPLKEEDPLLAIHPYGISKIAAELLARQYYINFNINVINLRFFNQTGVRRVNDAPSDFIRQVAQIELGLVDPIITVGNLNPYRDFTDIKDSIRAIWLVTLKGKPGEAYNICSNKKIQIRELLDIALSFSKKKIEVVENNPQKLRKADEDIIIGENSKINTLIGWQPNIPIEITLKDMFNYWLDYYKAHKDIIRKNIEIKKN
jgi:GDP-4-dehydro-6-deoxy-D-mannose reductase